MLEGAKYIDMACSIPAKIKLADCEKLGLRTCCFKETCKPRLGMRGPVTCDAPNFYMGGDGELKPSRKVYQHSLRAPKRPHPWETVHPSDEKATATAEKASKSIAAVSAAFEMDCVQTCRAFIHGRCLKDNDATRLPGDPMRCTEIHDKSENQARCCFVLKSSDPLYHKSFTKCRSIAYGKFSVSGGLRE